MVLHQEALAGSNGVLPPEHPRVLASLEVVYRLGNAVDAVLDGAQNSKVQRGQVKISQIAARQPRDVS